VNIIHKSIKYVNTEKLLIPFEGKVRSCVKLGDSFEKGDELFKVEGRKIQGSYSLVKDLGIKPEKTLDFVTRIEGEYISKNDVIAEKTVTGGLMAKRVVSEHEGIVNLSKAHLGYVNILSELGIKSCVASFDGVVKDVDFSKGIFVETDVCEMPMFFSNDKLDENIFGQLQVFSDAESIPSTRKMESSFEDKIVFVGRFLYSELAVELFRRGCKFILVGSMNYDDFKKVNVPIGILTGFGNIHFDSTRLAFLKELNGFQVSISKDTNLVQFPVGLNDKISRLIEQKYYTASLQKGDIVRSRDLESFGLVGEIISFDESGKFAKVLIQEGSDFTICVENLELYNEEFSIMRTRIF
jgi:hypothetical protein